MKHVVEKQSPEDTFGRNVAGRLSAGDFGMSHDIGERLRVARLQAIAKRKVGVSVAAGGAISVGSTAALHFGGRDGLGFWGRLASTLPLLVLAFGLLTIYSVQNEDRVNELAEVDAALLTDDLPTSAYTDPGFAQFLKTSGDSAQ